MNREQIALELRNDSEEIIDWVEEHIAEELTKKAAVELDLCVFWHEYDEELEETLTCEGGPETRILMRVSSVEQAAAILNLADEWAGFSTEWANEPSSQYLLWHEGGAIEIDVDRSVMAELVEEAVAVASKEGIAYRMV